jgi:indolepyruvate ferredoxin oxidoreductase alpha subunit
MSTLLQTGAQALARGAIEAGVSLVTSYPGAPATAVVNSIIQSTTSDQARVEWTANEKVAIEMAFGGSMAGVRSLLCVKGVGLNIGLDPLMAFNLSGVNAGLVILVGDDPGSWGSQNEQDSRTLAVAAEIPLIEPTSVPKAHSAMREAFRLSEETGLPVIVRVTRALVQAEAEVPAESVGKTAPPPQFQREFMRWVVLPINVVPYHRRLLERMDQVRAQFESSPFNGIAGIGQHGIIAAGWSYQKTLEAMGNKVPPELRILRLGSFNPLPDELVTGFLQSVETCLVVEETAPLVERAVQAVAQSRGLCLPIHGRDSGHIPRVGEVFSPHIAAAMNQLLPQLNLSEEGKTSRPMPSREPLCEGCFYIPTFDALLDVIDEIGGRENAIIVGDPGCMVKAQMEPYQLMDVKNSLGASIGMGAGIATALAQEGTDKYVIAICGDSGFLHSGFMGLVDAARVNARMLVLILDNGTTALSGGQPHPGSPVAARGQPRRAVDLAGLALETGAGMVRSVDVDQVEDIRSAILDGIRFDGLAVVIARGKCIG